MASPPKLILKSGKDQSLKRYHPWIFSGAIKKIYGHPGEGDIVHVYSNKDEFLGTGHFQNGSIAVRILSFESKEINDRFWYESLRKAWGFRTGLGLLKKGYTNIFRMVNAEGDGLPGLIIDYYNGTAVVQMHSIGMYKNIDKIVAAMQDVVGNELSGIYHKSSSTLPQYSDNQVKDEYIKQANQHTYALEYGNKFIIDWKEGQKTGFFIDQRENRQLLKHYAQDKAVLNMFCYTGGFSVYALRGGASLVHSVDSSKGAVNKTNDNIQLNEFENNKHQSYTADAFSYLNEIDLETYDIIVLDPPAFAKHINVLHNALQGYKRLNQKAIEKVKRGGLIFTFSCSQVVSKENFRKSVFAAAANTGRSVRLLHQLSQPPDHPVSIYHPEGEYLKGLVIKVD